MDAVRNNDIAHVAARPHRRAIVVAALALLVLAGAWRLPWYDERFTLLLTRQGFAGMLAATAGDVHPPLYYALAWGWMRLLPAGLPLIAQAFWLRMFSALCLAGAVIVFERLPDLPGVVRPNQRGLLTALFAVSGTALYYAVEGRMYALLLLLTLAAVYLGGRRRWGWLAAVNAALLYTHNYALFYLPVHGLYHLARERRITRGLVLAYALPVLLWTPWAAVLYRQAAAVHSGYWITPPRLGADILASLGSLAWGPGVGLAAIPGVMVTVAGLGYLGYRMLFSPPLARQCAPLLWLAFAPMLLAAAVSYLVQPVWLYRGLIGCAPWLVILLWCVPLSGRRLPLLWLGVAAPLLVVSAGTVALLRPMAMGQDVIPEYIADRWQPGDLLYSVNDGQSVNLLTSMPGYPLYQMPECPGSHDRGALNPATRAALGIRLQPLEAIPHRRAWVLYDVSYVTDPCRLGLADALVEGLTPQLTTVDNEFNRTEVYLLYGENR